jgi:hypothetical protein
MTVSQKALRPVPTPVAKELLREKSTAKAKSTTKAKSSFSWLLVTLLLLGVFILLGVTILAFLLTDQPHASKHSDHPPFSPKASASRVVPGKPLHLESKEEPKRAFALEKNKSLPLKGASSGD